MWALFLGAYSWACFRGVQLGIVFKKHRYARTFGLWFYGAYSWATKVFRGVQLGCF